MWLKVSSNAIYLYVYVSVSQTGYLVEGERVSGLLTSTHVCLLWWNFKMGRAIRILSCVHLALGLLCLGFGIPWIVLMLTDDRFKNENLPRWAYMVTLPEIVFGFLVCFAYILKMLDFCGLFLAILDLLIQMNEPKWVVWAIDFLAAFAMFRSITINSFFFWYLV